jgi:polar amino acid transport system substrate-binding protein
MKRIPAAVMFTVAAGVLLAACGGIGRNGTTSTSGASGIPNPIVFCNADGNPPMESIVSGTVAGADVDIANAVAKRLGSAARIKRTGFPDIIPALVRKECDAIINSLTITPGRSKSVHFTPYITVGALLMVKKGNPQHISTLASLSGKSADAPVSSTELAGLQAENKTLLTQGKLPIEIESYPDGPSAVLAGRVSAYLTDAPPVLYYIRRFPGGFQTAGTQVETAPEGIATRKGDPLGLKIGNAVQALYRNGKMRKILAKWHVSQFALKNG